MTITTNGVGYEEEQLTTFGNGYTVKLGEFDLDTGTAYWLFCCQSIGTTSANNVESLIWDEDGAAILRVNKMRMRDSSDSFASGIIFSEYYTPVSWELYFRPVS